MSTIPLIYNGEFRCENFIAADISFEDGTNTYKYILVPGNLAANANINVPVISGSDTMTLNAATQTLTNKTLTTPIIGTNLAIDNGSNTATINTTTSTNTTYTIPNKTTSQTFAMTSDISQHIYLNSVSNAVSTQFIGQFGQSATEFAGQILMNSSGNITRMAFRLENAPTAGNSWTFQLRRNGTDLPGMVTIADAETTGSSSAAGSSFAADDRLSVVMTATGAPAATIVMGTITYV